MRVDVRARAALRDAFALAPEAAVKAGVATVLTINADGDYKVEQPADEVAFMAAPAATRRYSAATAAAPRAAPPARAKVPPVVPTRLGVVEEDTADAGELPPPGGLPPPMGPEVGRLVISMAFFLQRGPADGGGNSFLHLASTSSKSVILSASTASKLVTLPYKRKSSSSLR